MNKRKIRKAVKRIKYLPFNKYLFYYFFNKTRHFYLRLTKSLKVAYPSTIMLELTNHCNLHCTTCPREYNYGQNMDKGHMKFEQVKRIIDELWPYLDSIGLTGMGETFMYQELEQVVDYIKSKNKGIIISVSTNAMFPGFIDKVARLINKIDTIQISIDGLGDVYEMIRVNASFKTLDENLKLLKELCRSTDTTLMLNMVVTKENYFQMPSLVKYASDIGIEFMDFTLFNLASVTDADTEYYNFYQTDAFLSVVDELEYVAKNHQNVTLTNRNFKTENGFRKCPFPWTHFYICWNGFVAPCCAKPFPKILNFGNAFDEKVINILNSKSFQAFRKMWYRNETPDFCKKCHFIGIVPIKK